MGDLKCKDADGRNGVRVHTKAFAGQLQNKSPQPLAAHAGRTNGENQSISARRGGTRIDS